MVAALADTSNVKPAHLSTSPEWACPPELAALMVGIAAGEQRALERFYRLTIGRVFGQALYLVRDRATAEEVAEDVYVQIWHTAADYDPCRCTPLGWALMICRSRAIDSFRRAEKAIVDPDPTERLDAIVQDVPGLQDNLQAIQAHRALHSALNRLQPLQRQLLGLAFFRGLTHAEIALVAHLPLGTVKSHIRRALLTLREEFDAA